MSKFRVAALAAIAALVGSGAVAQEPATSAWGSVYSPPTALERQVNLNAAELIELQRTGGLTSVTNIGTLNNTTTYNGPVSIASSNSATIGNSNSTSNTVNAVDSMVVITTSSDQSATNLNQTTGSRTTTTTFPPQGE